MTDSALVRLPPDLAACVATAAAADGVSVAAWLRALAVVAVGASEKARRPSRPRRSVPPQDIVAIARLREAVGLTVGALVRTAAFTRERDQLQTHAELESLIRSFRHHAVELDMLKIRLTAHPLVST